MMETYPKYLPAMNSWAVFSDDTEWGPGHQVAWANSREDAEMWPNIPEQHDCGRN
jgi:hypothetical protein